MLESVRAMLWKEQRELLLQRGSLLAGLRDQLALVAVFGGFLPWTIGPALVSSPLILLSWAWMPLFLIGSTVADSIAGERERHTLETLLASCLPDGVILAGKIAVAVLYGWLMTVVCAGLALVTVNLRYPAEHLRLYSPVTLLGIIAVPALAGLLIAGVGVLMSMHAPTVRGAQQRLGTAVVLLCPLALLSNRLPADLLASVAARPLPAMLVALGLLAGLDCLVLAIAKAQFRRHRILLGAG